MTAREVASPWQEPQRTTQTRPLRCAETLRRQFRHLMQTLTRRTPGPEPRPRHREGDETSRGFSMAARRITRRAVRSILRPITHAFPISGWDLVSWLQQWAEFDQAQIGDDCQDDAGRPDEAEESSSLSLHL
jgi:hypothetical protein